MSELTDPNAPIVARITALQTEFAAADLPWEDAPCCPLCGSAPLVGRVGDGPDASRVVAALASHDRYQHPAPLVTCGNCSMIWLSRRLTPEGYARYYGEGWYRRFVGAITGQPDLDVALEHITEQQVAYAAFLVGRLRSLGAALRLEPGSPVLDFGGSAGFIGRRVADALVGAEAPVALVDPAAWECRAERVERYLTLAEARDAHPTREYALALVCQTIDHLSHPVRDLREIVSLLAPEGVVWIDFLDTTAVYAQEKAWWKVAKLDHPMYFTEPSARFLLRLAGLCEPPRLPPSGRHLYALCRRARP